MKKTVKDYMAVGLTAFLVVCGILVFYDTVFASRTLLVLAGKLMNILQPVFYGCVIAYLLLPIVGGFDGSIRHRIQKEGKTVKRPGLIRAAALLLTWVLALAVLYVLFSIILPQVVDSISNLANNFESYYNKVLAWGTKLLADNEKLGAFLLDTFNTYYDELMKWVRTDLLPQAQQLVLAVTGGIWSFVQFATDLVVGVVISVYLLFSKEKWSAGCRRISAALFAPRSQRMILRGVHRADTIFSGFIRGKLLDSLIVGIVCLIACMILKIPYAPLVSVIVGVTNVIPFFGPFLGAVPSGLLILLASPVKCLTFVILIIVLQQLDGNILDPRIVGDSIGLPPFWIIVAILLGGGLFGITGMFLGVPVFACFYTLLDTLIRWKLRKKQLSEDVSAYVTPRGESDAAAIETKEQKQ